MTTETLRLARSKRIPRILSGHLWAFRSDLAAPPTLAGVADLVDSHGRFVGRGLASPRSEICFRLLTRRDEPIDAAFFTRRLDAAIALRRREGLDGEPHRLVFSEGDLLPGFTVDRYGDAAVLGIGTAGAEALRGPFLDALASSCPGLAVLERSDASSRTREGLEPRVEPALGAPPERVTTTFDGISTEIGLLRGQKTGAYLDVRDLRRDLRARSTGARVLDCFAHIGLFSRYAAAGGAAKITAIETDAAAAAQIRTALPEAEVIEENGFDVLRRFEREGREFDRIVLDPPPFTKSARAKPGAARGYKEINLRAMNLLAPGGMLWTSSCSFHMSREEFREVVLDAAADAGRELRVARTFCAAPDHPVHLSVPETDYLKGLRLEAYS